MIIGGPLSLAEIDGGCIHLSRANCIDIRIGIYSRSPAENGLSGRGWRAGDSAGSVAGVGWPEALIGTEEPLWVESAVLRRPWRLTTANLFARHYTSGIPTLWRTTETAPGI